MAGGFLLVLAFLYLFLLLQGVTLVSAGGNPQTAPEDIHLLKFKGNILFDPFHALIDWTSSNPLCNWTGVECDNYNHVLRLDLQNKLLRGSIAPDIASLEHLKYLNLENNSFIGQIPGGLGALSNLLELRLGLNPLSGSIPDDIWSMRGIRYIDISGTNISGGLSPSIRSLTNISYLYLNHNKLGGAIPSEMGTLQSLQKLYINGNGFSGEFPVEIMGLPILSTLDISNNNFSGVVPAGRSGLTFRFSNNAHLSACTNRNIRGLRDIPTPAPIANQKAGSYPSYLASAAIIGVLSAAVFILLLGGLLFYYRIFKQRKHITNNSKFTENDEEHAWTIYTRRFTFDHLRRATKNFSPDSIIGSGGFGLVYKARLDTGEIVAIKRSIQESYQGHNEFHNEVKLLSKVHHKHLVNLVGFCEESGEQMLVYEYAPNGSLLDHIVGENGMLLTWTQRVQIAIDSAKGIAYLHEGCSPAIIHRDIKPSNILLGYDFEAKVSDFGLSKLGPDGNASHVSTQVKGTPGYLDPHYYLSFHLSTFSDVYSFGVIMLQLVTARPAVDHSRKRSQYHVINWVRNSVERGCLEDIMDPRLMSQPYNREVLLEMSKIGLRCTSKDMKGRPTMSMVGQELEMAVWINRKPMVLQWSMSPEELGVRRKRGDELLRQNLFGDAYALPKKQHLDASYEQHHDASYALPKKQHLDASYEQHHDADLGAKYIEGQRSMDNSGINKSMEVGYHWNQEESLSSEKSLDWSQAGLETFHMDLEGLSTINVRCLDSNDEWEDQNSISSDNHRPRKT